MANVNSFVNELDLDDLALIFNPASSHARIGRITGDYRFTDNKDDPSGPHQRPTQWTSTTVDLGRWSAVITDHLQGYDLLTRVGNDGLISHLIDVYSLNVYKSATEPSQNDRRVLKLLEANAQELQGWKIKQQRYSSDELHHFVAASMRYDLESGYNRLKDILQSGHLTPDPSNPEYHPIRLEINPEGTLINEDLVRPAIVCFCDIPADDIGIHSQKYGRFGLSFRKLRLSQYGARPVIYIPWFSDDWISPHGRPLLKYVEDTYKRMRKERKLFKDQTIYSDDSREAARKALTTLELHFLAFIKPFQLDLPDDDLRQYSLEREWRILGSFKFSLSDVQRIFLPQRFASRFRNDFPQYENQLTFV